MSAERPFASPSEHLEVHARRLWLLTERALRQRWSSGQKAGRGQDPEGALRLLGATIGAEHDRQGPRLQSIAAELAALNVAVARRTRLTMKEGITLPIESLAQQLRMDRVAQDVLLMTLGSHLDPRLAAALQHLAEEPDGPPVTGHRVVQTLSSAVVGTAKICHALHLNQPLRRFQLLRLLPGRLPGLLGCGLEVPEDVLQQVQGNLGTHDPNGLWRVVPAGERSAPPEASDEALRAVAQMASDRGETGRAGLVFLYGARSRSKSTVVIDACRGVGRAVLRIFGKGLAHLSPADAQTLLARIFREGVVHEAIPYLDGHEHLVDPACPHGAELLALLDEFPGPLVFSTDSDSYEPPRTERALLAVRVHGLNGPSRLSLWESGTRGLPLAADVDLANLAYRFPLDDGAVTRAVRGCRYALAIRPAGAALSQRDLQTAIKAQCSEQLARFAQRIEPVYGWHDLIAPAENIRELQEVLDRVRLSDVVYGEWGLLPMTATPPGISALFFGAPGTGKTMSASIIARELGLDLYRIDLSTILSKWIGETEKHLAEVFDAAEAAQVVLLFDEADSLFARRTEVNTAQDRYANTTVAFLLQRIESYTGLVVMTTNLDKDIDPAFKRRFTFRVSFPEPTMEERLRLWSLMLPGPLQVPVVDELPRLARDYDMTGGHIRNAATRALFYAATQGQGLDAVLLERACRQEMYNLGRLVVEESPDDL